MLGKSWNIFLSSSPLLKYRSKTSGHLNIHIFLPVILWSQIVSKFSRRLLSRGYDSDCVECLVVFNFQPEPHTLHKVLHSVLLLEYCNLPSGVKNNSSFSPAKFYFCSIQYFIRVFLQIEVLDLARHWMFYTQPFSISTLHWAKRQNQWTRLLSWDPTSRRRMKPP